MNLDIYGDSAIENILATDEHGYSRISINEKATFLS
jgi:hypothetical protein